MDANLKIKKFGNDELRKLELVNYRKYENQVVRKLGNLEICKIVNMEIRKLGIYIIIRKIWKFGNSEISNKKISKLELVSN